MAEKDFSTQINDAFGRVAAEFNKVRTEIAAGGQATTAEKVTLTDGKTVQQAIDDLNYKAISISSLTCSVGTQEIGATVTEATISWKLSKAAKNATLNNEAVETAVTGSKTFTDLEVKANTTYTLAVTDDRDAKASKSVTISFLNRVYWGKSSETNGDNVNSEFVLGLSDSALAGNFVRDITFNAAAGEYLYYAIPTSMGTPHFWSGGFEGGVSAVKTFNHTNASGATASYTVYRTDNAGLGQTTINVKA